MKIYLCLAMVLLSLPLCSADTFSPTAITAIDQALLATSIADSNYTGPAVIALSECDCPGIIFGSVSPIDALTTLNNGIHINSIYNPGGSSGAFDQSGHANPIIIANYINVVGGIDDHYDWPEDVYVHDYTYDIAPVPDPYEYLPDHDVAVIRAMSDNGTITDANNGQTLSPGYYSGGIQIASANIILAPGDYYLDSVGQSASMRVLSGSIAGEGVTLHIVGDADHGIEINGNAIIDISAPNSGTYEGIAIYQKRNPMYDCTQSCTTPWSYAVPISEFTVLGYIFIDGVVYMPHNRLELSGNGRIELRRVVADRLYVNGTAEKIIGYDGTDYIPGDLIKNDSVDINDLIFFCMQWGVENPLSDMYSESNLNYDMNLDLQDFAILASHWSEGVQ